MVVPKVRLNDPVTAYLPAFQGGKSEITVRQLLTHYSGLRPDLDLEPEWSGYDTGIARALVDKPVAAPGDRFIYSDINFELLAEIVRVASGKPLPEFVDEQVFRPLGMSETRFQPPAEWRARIAPTCMRMFDFVSAAPLPKIAPSRSVASKGGDSHLASSPTGTTS